MIDWATHHSNTTSLRPVVPLSLGTEERPSGLQQGLVNPSSSSNDTNGSTGEGRDGLLGSGRQPDPGLLVLDRVSDNGSVATGSTGERTSVSGTLLDVADDGTLGALSDGENVTDVEGGLLSTIEERTGGETLGSDESLLTELVSVWVSEDNSSQGGTSKNRVESIKVFTSRYEHDRIGFKQPCNPDPPNPRSAVPTTSISPRLSFLSDQILYFQFDHARACYRHTYRPVSWMMSLTIPLMYPFFSAKSRGLSLAGFFLLWVWALKIPPDLRWFLMTRCYTAIHPSFIRQAIVFVDGEADDGKGGPSWKIRNNQKQ
jgi:hypothetical protein